MGLNSTSSKFDQLHIVAPQGDFIQKLIDVNELFISISGRQGTLPKFNYNFLGSNWLTRLLEKEKI